MSRILIIEDEPAILRGLADNFRRESYEVLTAEDGEKGYALILDKRPDAVILDLMLPRMSGYEICRKLRAAGDVTPIIMLTARGEETDRVLGLDLGADDYVTKPFSIRELLARVRALLRRARPQVRAVDSVRICGVEINFLSYEALKNGAPLEMTRREYQVLRALVSRPNEVLSRDELLDEVVGEDVYITNRTIDNHVASLRAKIETDPAEPRHLLTVRGVGYKFIA